MKKCPYKIKCWFPVRADYNDYSLPWRIIFMIIAQIFFWLGTPLVCLKIIFSHIVNATRTQQIHEKVSLCPYSEEPYYIALCATKGYIHGHGFIIWGRGEERTFTGFYPENTLRGTLSVFVKAAGKIKYGYDAKNENEILYSLEVKVDKKTYEKAQEITRFWENTYYEGNKRDCLTYLYSIAETIGLKNPIRGYFYLYMIPETYLPKLIRLNCTPKQSKAKSALTVKLAPSHI